MEQLFGSASLATCLVGRDQRIARASEPAAAIFGLPTLEGLSAGELLPLSEPVIRRCFELAALGAPLPTHEFTARGRRYAATFHATQDAACDGLLVVALDLSRRARVETVLRQSRRRLMAATRTDHLTGLLNRRGLEATLRHELRRSRRRQAPLALLIIDIDWFKAYNDALGHPEGDRCLRRVADALTGCLRRAGDAACRFGGEEFVIVLPDTDAAGAAIVAANCRQAIARLAIAHPASPLGRLTASIGIAAAEAGAVPAEADALFVEADEALYRAKRNGRNRHDFADRN
ncbi:diguanylate cyclase [Novosphingobium resinovorum]|uniref:diguanylate cyclase n=1 Tax=Novosphingobium resinovorum TaxID=158500 RepID=UPI002ED13170